MEAERCCTDEYEKENFFVLNNKKTQGRTDHAAGHYRCRNVDSASEGRHVDVICYVKQEEMKESRRRHMKKWNNYLYSRHW